MSINKAAFAKALMVGGGILAAAGGLAFALSRRGNALGRAATPPVVSVTRGKRMKLTHYRGRMPIKERLRLLQDLVWKGIQDPENRKRALAITRHCPERDGLCEAKAVYKAMKQLRYTGDVAPVKMGADGPVEGIDLFQNAQRTWEFKGGDCDDHSVFGATMLALNGITPRLRVTAVGKDDEFSHIYVVAGLPKLDPEKWVALDSTLPGGDNFGREVPYGRSSDYDA